MAAQCYEYNWKAWRTEGIIPKTKALPFDAFFIQIRTRDYVVCRNLHSNSVDDQHVEEPISPLKLKSLWVKKDSLLNDEQEARSVVCDVLHSMEVPRRLLRVVVEDIVAFGRSMEDYTPGRHVLPMVLGFSTKTMETTDENDVCNPRRFQFDMPMVKRRRVEDSRTCVA